MQQMLFRLVRGFYAYAAAWKRVEGSGDEKRRQRWMTALLKASETAEIAHLPETLTEEIMNTVDTNRALLPLHSVFEIFNYSFYLFIYL